jgi:hypothetical protein
MLMIEGFRQVIACAELDRLDCIRNLRVRGQHDHRHPDLQLLQAPQQADAIHPLHPIVEDHRGRRALQNVTQGDVAVAGGARAKIVAAQQAGQRLTHLLVIVDNQNVRFLSCKNFHRRSESRATILGRI